MADVKTMAVILIVLWSALAFQSAYGDGECGKTSVKTAAVSMVPCVEAASDGNASVPALCCIQVKKLLSFPTCACAIYKYSPPGQQQDELVQRLGINISVAITIPQRCNLSDLLAQQRCGNNTA